MIVQLFESPLGIVRCLRRRLRWLLPLVALVVGLYSCDGRPSTQTYKNAADFVVVVIVFLCGAFVLAFKFYTAVWLDFSLNFSMEPWEKVSDGVCCPFYPMKEAVVECPSCGAVVSKDALHKDEVFDYGDVVLNWDKAQTVVERIDKLLQSRIKLDNILNLKGNPTTHAIGECCIGCYAHYRCYNNVPRLSHICLMFACMFSFLPWVATDLYAMAPPGMNGFGGCIAVIYAGSAVLMELDCLATQAGFRRAFPTIPFPYPNLDVLGLTTRGSGKFIDMFGAKLTTAH